MGILRKLLGGLFLLLVVVPLVNAGIVVYVLSGEDVIKAYSTQVPSAIVKRLPGVLDQTLEVMASRPQRMTDRDLRAWVKALKEAGVKPSVFLKQTRLQGWLQGELTKVLREFGYVALGRRSSAAIVIDFVPLKQALKSHVFRAAVVQVFQKLPQCDVSGLRRWRTAVQMGLPAYAPPTCSPPLSFVQLAWSNWQREVDSIMDRETLLSSWELPQVSQILRSARSFAWLAVVLPLLLLLFGAWVASSSGLRGLLGAAGLTLAFAASVPLLASFSLERLFLEAVHLDQLFASLARQGSIILVPAERELTRLMLPLLQQLLAPPLDAIQRLALGLGLCGLGLFVASFMVPSLQREAEVPDA